MFKKAPRAVGVFPNAGLVVLLIGCASDTADTGDTSMSASPSASQSAPPAESMGLPAATPAPPAASPPATPNRPVPPTVPEDTVAPGPATTTPPLPTAPSGGSGGMSNGGMNAGGMSGGGGPIVASGGSGGAGAGAPGLGGASGSSASGGAGGEGGNAGDDGGNAGDDAGGSGGAMGGGEAQSAGCGAERTLMNGRKTIQSGGTNRDYILRVPDDYDNTRPYRLVMAYHWLSGNAEQVANGGGSTEDPYYGLWDLAENSTIFVAPEGLDAGWANSGDRDIALTDVILEEIQNDLCIDTTRIFATGFSYGGGMSFALACARADVFRGVALYAGAQLSGCNGGTTPIAYFHAHGVVDSVLNISQGRQLRDRFVEVNGCTSQMPPEPAQNSGTHICTSYEGCSDGHPVRWCAHGGDHNPTEKDQGQNESWVPGEAWAFISQF